MHSARFSRMTLEYGVEKHVELDNLSSKEVEQKITQLLSS